MLLCYGLQGRESGRPPVSSLRLYPEGVIRAVWQGKLEALKALTMDSALAAVKAAEIVRENGSSAWKNAVPGRRLLFLGFSFCSADLGGLNKRASGLLFKAGSRMLSKNLRRTRKGRILSNLQTYQAACRMGTRQLFAAKRLISRAKTGEGGMRRGLAYLFTSLL